MTNSVKVNEIFESLQGESSYSGLNCFFIRLTGCNLRCQYCDTTYAYDTGKDTSIEELTARWHNSKAVIAEITGGEPLLQKNFPILAKALRDESDRKVLVETNGSQDISVIPENVTAIIDVKCPASGEGNSFYLPNIEKLRVYDELKFVISNRTDYEWAVDFVKKYNLTKKGHTVLFSTVAGKLNAGVLGKWIINDKLQVRLQLQLHKFLNLK